MKAKIDQYGNLWIERGGVMKKQWCPYSVANHNGDIELTECGDWCPLFQEPGYNGGVVTIVLCNSVFDAGKPDEFVDERSKK